MGAHLAPNLGIHCRIHKWHLHIWRIHNWRTFVGAYITDTHWLARTWRTLPNTTFKTISTYARGTDTTNHIIMHAIVLYGVRSQKWSDIDVRKHRFVEAYFYYHSILMFRENIFRRRFLWEYFRKIENKIVLANMFTKHFHVSHENIIIVEQSL